MLEQIIRCLNSSSSSFVTILCQASVNPSEYATFPGETGIGV